MRAIRTSVDQAGSLEFMRCLWGSKACFYFVFPGSIEVHWVTSLLWTSFLMSPGIRGAFNILSTLQDAKCSPLLVSFSLIYYFVRSLGLSLVTCVSLKVTLL
jgi:hypothetical protein